MISKVIPKYLICTIIFSSTLHALSKRRLTAEDPNAKSIVATHELSPFQMMSAISTFGSILLLSKYSTSDEWSPDFKRDKVQKIKNVAVEVLIYGGMINQLYFLVLAKPLINKAEREKIGEITFSDVNTQWLASERKVFLYFHGLNFLMLSAVASQSQRADRWSIVASQAMLPFVVDLSSRYIFRSQTVSPWTFSFFPKFENQSTVHELILSYSW